MFTPRETTLDQVAHGAPMRRRIEVGFEEAKGSRRPDAYDYEYECRMWEAWRRRITPSLLAHACLSGAREHKAKSKSEGVIDLATMFRPGASTPAVPTVTCWLSPVP